MTTPPTQPHLTPQFCFSSTALQDFLRLSRSTIDDSITSSLNALLTPSTLGFDPSSTRTRQLRSGNRLPSKSCAAFKNQVLFPSWRSRDDVLAYCEGIAAQPDASTKIGTLDVHKEDERTKIVDNRADPYETRPQVKYGRKERLEDVLRTERGVERIIRSRTWGVVNARCASGNDEESWDEAMSRNTST